MHAALNTIQRLRIVEDADKKYEFFEFQTLITITRMVPLK